MAPINKKFKAIMMLSKYQEKSDQSESSNDHSHDLNGHDGIYHYQLNCLHSYKAIEDSLNQKELRENCDDMSTTNQQGLSSSSDSNQYSPISATLNSNENQQRRKSGSKLFLDKGSDEYRLRRERNNIAVRKSRSKSKLKFIQTMERINQLEDENRLLLARVRNMSQDLKILKFILIKHVSESHGAHVGEFDLFNQDESSMDSSIGKMMGILKDI